MSEVETARRLLANWQEKNLMDFRRGIFSEKENNISKGTGRHDG